MFEQLTRMRQEHDSVPYFPDETGDPEVQATLLGRRADEVLESGQTYEAVQWYDAALAIARDLAMKHRSNDQYSWMIASLQYSQAGALMALNCHTEAIEALDESERRYRETDARDISHFELRIADIQTRRGLAQHARGHGISAVLELDAAVIAYHQLFTGKQDDPCILDLARILTMNATVLRAWGDPDLAVASADAALRLYTLAEQSDRYQAQAIIHMGRWHMAAEIAAELHAAHGRLQIAIAADAMASAIAQSMLNHAHSAEHRQMLARALVRQGLHMQALDGSRAGEALIARGQALDAKAARQAMAQWRLAQAGHDPIQVTVVTSLAVAAQELGTDRVPETLAAAVTRPGVDVALLSPSDRCNPDQAADYALRLAEISLTLWNIRRAEALRLGVEAHYLFAVASRMRTLAMRYRMCDYGPPWARILLACAQEYETRRQMSAALDLAAWAQTVARRLLPLSLLDKSLRPLICACIEQHGRLSIANGDREMGKEILQQTQHLWSA